MGKTQKRGGSLWPEWGVTLLRNRGSLCSGIYNHNSETMNILKINNGKVEIRKDNGSLVRTIGNGDAISADINSDQSMVVITTNKGKVEIRKGNGSLVRTIGNNDATNAKWYGSEIAVTTVKGKTELRKENGSLIRTM